MGEGPAKKSAILLNWQDGVLHCILAQSLVTETKPKEHCVPRVEVGDVRKSAKELEAIHAKDNRTAEDERR